MRSPKPIEIALTILVIGFIIFIDMIYPKFMLNKDYRFTICTIVREVSKGRGGNDLEFEFYVNNNKFKGQVLNTFNEKETKILINKRFLVKYNPQMPKINAIYFEYCIKDISITAPDTGWIEIPKTILK
jgi:hypothetical protein